MNRIQGLLAAAAASLALVGTAARADTTWNFSYTGNGVQGSGSFQTAGDGSTPSAVLDITGTFDDPTITNGTIDGVVPLGADGTFNYDNLFGGTTYFSGDGLLFDVNGSEHVNLYYNGSGYSIVAFESGSILDEDVSLTISAVAAPVPEPGTLAMVLAGLVALTFASRRISTRQ